MATRHELQWLLEGVQEEKDRARVEGFAAGIFFATLVYNIELTQEEGDALMDGLTAGDPGGF